MRLISSFCKNDKVEKPKGEAKAIHRSATQGGGRD
jgi:hypothetical protein